MLERNGIDPEKMANKIRSARHCDVTNVQAVITTLNRHNIVAVNVITKYPQLLRIPPHVLDGRAEALKRLLGELQMPKAIGKYPTLLGLITHKLEIKMRMLTSLGLDPHLMVKRCPAVFGHSEHAIHSRLVFFEKMGLDAVRIINKAPEVVGVGIQCSLRPLIDYITKDMGRSLEEINKCPRCFSTSLEERLKPRHEYLKLYGRRQDYSLSTICCITDDRFAKITNQTPDHYRRWLPARNR